MKTFNALAALLTLGFILSGPGAAAAQSGGADDNFDERVLDEPIDEGSPGDDLAPVSPGEQAAEQEEDMEDAGESWQEKDDY